MKITTILDKRQCIGIRIGNVGIGLLIFPWIYIFGNRPLNSASFWEWLICPPMIFINSENEKATQFRFMWFVIQVVSGKK